MNPNVFIVLHIAETSLGILYMVYMILSLPGLQIAAHEGKVENMLAV